MIENSDARGLIPWLIAGTILTLTITAITARYACKMIKWLERTT